MKIGYFLSCEGWGPNDVVGQAAKAQQAGFDGLRAHERAGVDELYINQIGPDQDAFFAAYGDRVLAEVR